MWLPGESRILKQVLSPDSDDEHATLLQVSPVDPVWLEQCGWVWVGLVADHLIQLPAVLQQNPYAWNLFADGKFQFYNKDLEYTVQGQLDKVVQEFWRLLAICHTVMVQEKDSKWPGTLCRLLPSEAHQLSLLSLDSRDQSLEAVHPIAQALLVPRGSVLLLPQSWS